MERKVLIAVDGSLHSNRAIRYVGRTFKDLDEFKVDLAHLIKGAPPFLVKEARSSGTALAKVKKIEAKEKASGQAILDKAAAELGKQGFTGDRIDSKLLRIRTGVAKELVMEAQNGLYDALVVGRQGKGLVQEMIMGSVSLQCVELAQSVPVWVIDGEPDPDRVLVALDGSEDSFRAVDHVGFIMARHPSMRATLIHVSTALAAYCSLDEDEELTEMEEELIAQEEDYCLRNYFGKAIRMLGRAGVETERIEVNFVAKGLELSRSILKEAAAGNFGTIVVGRKGTSRIKGLLMGSVSNRILQAGQDRAVWVIS